MKNTFKNWFAALLLAAPMSMAVAAGGHANYEKVDIDLGDQVSLQRLDLIRRDGPVGHAVNVRSNTLLDTHFSSLSFHGVVQAKTCNPCGSKPCQSRSCAWRCLLLSCCDICNRNAC